MDLNPITMFAVVSDPGGRGSDFDPIDEALFGSRELAEAHRTRMLDEIEADGLDRSQWEPVIWIEQRSYVLEIEAAHALALEMEMSRWLAGRMRAYARRVGGEAYVI